MPTVISDTDFLSSFLKIGRLDLVREFCQVETLWIPPWVYREVAETELLTRLAEVPWIRIAAPDADILNDLLRDEDFRDLGAGAQESIALALGRAEAVLMISDNKARKIASRLGVVAIHIPAFLLACKVTGLVNREALEAIVQDLRNKDYYEFRPDVLGALLS
ncbi:MAG: hypothetical protein CVU38_08000 [Chloroflexi bacterium HGW-Chloroflexi-1]|nr:MAG: hypothetical protein CVU38_08000 [Chloroflexi bacterium HGW-Chloroflexi-1]